MSVFKVGFAGGLLYEGPVCDKNGRVKEWHSASAEWRYAIQTLINFCRHLAIVTAVCIILYSIVS